MAFTFLVASVSARWLQARATLRDQGSKPPLSLKRCLDSLQPGGVE